MRVMCINHDWEGMTGPEYGEICEVIKEHTHWLLSSLNGYILEGYEPDRAYRTQYFIPLSDEPEETEVATEPIAEPCLQ